MLKLAVFAAVATLAAAQSCSNPFPFDNNFQANYEQYTPGKHVKSWGKRDFETKGSYFVNTATGVAIPLIVVGVLIFVGVSCWSCYRCCCGKCKLNEASTMCSLILLVATIALLVACFAMVITSLAANDDQSDTLKRVPIVVDSFVSVVTEIADEVAKLTGALSALSTQLENYNSAATSEIRNDLNEIITQLNDIDATAAGSDIDSLKGDFSDSVEDADKSRSSAFRTVLGILCTFIILSAIIAIMNAKGPDSLKPISSSACRCFAMRPIAFITIVLGLALWLLAAVLGAITAISSDFCVQADTNLLETANLNSNDAATFFATCDESAEIRSCRNPFADPANQIETLFAEIRSDWTSVKPTPCNNDCAAVDQAIESMISDLEEFAEKFLGCAFFNSRYQLVIILFCGEAVESFGSTTNVLIGFAVLYALVLLITPCLTDTADEDNDGSSYGESKAV